MESQLKEKTAHLFTIFMLFILAVLLFILFMIVVIVTANKPISEDYKVEIIKVKKDIAELSITLPHAFQEFISALLIQSAIICVFFASKLLEFYHFLIRKSLDFYDSLFFSQKDYEAAKTYQVKLKLETFDNLRLSDSETEDRLYTLRPQMEKYLTYLAPAEALPLLISSRLTKASRRLYWLGVFIAPSFILNIHFYIVDAVKILTCNIISLIIFSILIIFVYFNNEIGKSFKIFSRFLFILIAIYLLTFFFFKNFMIVLEAYTIYTFISLLFYILFKTEEIFLAFLSMVAIYEITSKNLVFITLIMHIAHVLGANNVTIGNYNVVTYVVLVALYDFVVLIVGMYCLQLIFSFVKIIVTRRVMISHPIAILVEDLMNILNPDEEWNHNDWGEFEHKQPLLIQLEKASKSIERGLSTRIHTGDSVTDEWFRGRGRQVAAALRQKKKWVLAPKEDTHYFFLQSIAFMLIYILKGNWDALELGEAERLTRPEFRSVAGRFVAKGLRTILVAALPIAAFFTLQNFFPNFLQGAVLTSVISVIFIYEITVLGSLLDPDFSKKTLDAQDLMSKLIPGSTKKES